MLRRTAIWVAFLGLSILAALPCLLDSQIVYEPGATLEESRAGTLDASWSADEILTRFGGPPGNEYRGGDLASYLLAARQLLGGNGFSEAFVPFWPPGMAVWAATVLTVFGDDAYVRGMILGSAFLWSFALLLVYLSARPVGSRRYWTFGFVAAFLALPTLHDFTFGFGSLMSEAPSHAFFVAAMALLVRGLLDDDRKSIVASAICMAAAALLRALFDYIALAWFVGLPLLLGTVWLVRTIWSSRDSSLREVISSVRLAARSPRPRILRLAATLLLSLLAYQGALLPWRVYKQVNFSQHGLVDFDQKYAWSWSWMTDEELPWFHRSGNAACHVDHRLCKVVREHRADLSGFHLQKLAVATFLAQPGRWWKFKAKHLDWFWFGNEWSVALFERPLIGLEGLLLFGLGIGSLVILSARTARTGSPESALILSTMLLAILVQGAIFNFLQYEWRYSQALRTLMYFLPLWTYVIWKQPGQVPLLSDK